MQAHLLKTKCLGQASASGSILPYNVEICFCMSHLSSWFNSYFSGRCAKWDRHGSASARRDYTFFLIVFSYSGRILAVSCCNNR